MSLLVIISWFLMGALCAYYGRERGRNPYIWFFVGLLFGILGLILLFIMPNLKVTQPVKEPPKLEPPKLNIDAMYWYYLDEENNQLGPMSQSAFDLARTDGKVVSQTFVWNTQMDQWKKLEEI